jgi:hypothetical protein
VTREEALTRLKTLRNRYRDYEIISLSKMLAVDEKPWRERMQSVAVEIEKLLRSHDLAGDEFLEGNTR